MSLHEILTISADKTFASSLLHVRRCVTCFQKTGAIATRFICKGERSELVILLKGESSSPSFVRKIVGCVVDAIADIIVTDCKSHYIESSLRLPIEDEFSRHAFIRALSTFDSETDKVIAKSLINLTPQFLLDSFYRFMTDDLKVRWQEVCGLANDNAAYLVCAGTFRELLRFLISNLESREREVHLFDRDGEVEILGGGLQPISGVYVNEELPQDVRTVTKLITIAPKKIFVHYDAGGAEKPVLCFIQSLFGGCVHVVQN